MGQKSSSLSNKYQVTPSEVLRAESLEDLADGADPIIKLYMRSKELYDFSKMTEDNFYRWNAMSLRNLAFVALNADDPELQEKYLQTIHEYAAWKGITMKF